MGDAGARRIIVAMWILAIAVIGWREIKGKPGELPSPAPFLGSVMVYGGLLIGAEFAAGLAAALAGGWTLGLLYSSVAGSSGARLATGSEGDPISRVPAKRDKRRNRTGGRR